MGGAWKLSVAQMVPGSPVSFIIWSTLILTLVFLTLSKQKS